MTLSRGHSIIFLLLVHNLFSVNYYMWGLKRRGQVMTINYRTVIDVARELGVSAPQIRYAHVSGRVADPQWHHGRRAYKDVDVERLRQYFAAKKRVY